MLVWVKVLLVRGLVEMHGGTIEARSGGPGRGSELIVRLPQAKPEPLSKSQAEEADRQKTSPMPKSRILVVLSLRAPRWH